MIAERTNGRGDDDDDEDHALAFGPDLLRLISDELAQYRGGLMACEDVMRKDPGKAAGVRKTVAALAEEIIKSAELLRTVAEA